MVSGSQGQKTQVFLSPFLGLTRPFEPFIYFPVQTEGKYGNKKQAQGSMPCARLTHNLFSNWEVEIFDQVAARPDMAG